MKFDKKFIAVVLLCLIINSSVLSFKHEVSALHRRSVSKVGHHRSHHTTRKSSKRHSKSHYRISQQPVNLPEDEVKKCDEEVNKSKIDVGALFGAFILKITSTSFFNDVLAFSLDTIKFDRIEDKCLDILEELFDKKLEENTKSMREIYNQKGNGLLDKINELKYATEKEKEELRNTKSPKKLCHSLNKIYDQEKGYLIWKEEYKKTKEVLENAKKTGMTLDQMKTDWKKTFFTDFSTERRAQYKALTFVTNRYEDNKKTITDEKELFNKSLDEATNKANNILRRFEETEAKKDNEYAKIEYCDNLPDEFNPCADLTTGRITKSIVQVLTSLKGSACVTFIATWEGFVWPSLTAAIVPAMEKFMKSIFTSWLLPVKILWYLIRITICTFKAYRAPTKFVRSWMLGNAAAYFVKLIVTSLTAGTVFKKKKLRRRYIK